jgi:hypothetical protein
VTVQGRLRPFARLGALLLGVFVLGLLVAARITADAATAATVELRIWPAGQGRIEVTQNGAAVPVTHNGETLPFCDFISIFDSSDCRAVVTAGQAVTFTAVAEPTLTQAQKDALDEQHKQHAVPDLPAAQVSFVRWSRADCQSGSACTFTPQAEDDGDWVMAYFTPLQLEVGINGNGTVAIQGGPALQCAADETESFGQKTCHGLFPPDTTLVLVATGTGIKWGDGCDPENGNPASARCTVTVNNIRTFAAVGFGGADPPGFPFQITARVRTRAIGTGHGKVTGSGSIDCGTKCSADLGYQSKVTLKAEADSGSSFVKWVGVCATDPTCSFAAGSASFVQARFDAQATTTAATTTTAPTTTTRATTTVATTTASPTTTTTTTAAATTTGATATTAQAALTSRLVGAAVTGKGKHRVVVTRIVLNRRARVSVRLRGHGTSILFRSVVLPARRSALRLPVPAHTPAGVYVLTLTVVAGPNHQTLTTPLRIGR